MKTVCLIPARGGSVRIPHKNRRMFKGKPIIQYSIENARKSGLFDSVVVSTDDFDIMNLAAELGASTYLRDYDDGTKGTQEVAADFLNSFDGRNYGLCCVLYPCAPLLTWRDLVYGFKWLLNSGSRHVYVYSANDYSDVGGYYWGFAQAFREGAPLDHQNAAAVSVSPSLHFDINTNEEFALAEQTYASLNQRL